MKRICALAASLCAMAVPSVVLAQSPLPHGWTKRTAAGGSVLLKSPDGTSVIEFQSIVEQPTVTLLDQLRGAVNQMAAAYPQVRTVNAPKETDLGATHWADIIVTFNKGGVQYERLVRIGVKDGHGFLMDATAPQREFGALMRIVNAGVDPAARPAAAATIEVPEAWKAETMAGGFSASAPDGRAGVRFRVVSSSGDMLTDIYRVLSAVRKQLGPLGTVQLQFSRGGDGATAEFRVRRAGEATVERITVIRHGGRAAVQQTFAPENLPLPLFRRSVSGNRQLYSLTPGSRWLMVGKSRYLQLPSDWPAWPVPTGLRAASSREISKATAGLEAP